MQLEKSMTDTDAPKKKPWQRLLPIGVIALALIAFYAFGLQEFIALESLRKNQSLVQAYADSHRYISMLLTIVIYASLTAISFPGAAILTLLSGFVLGTLYGGISVVIGATIGATIIFLAGRSAAGDIIARKGGEKMARLEAGFAKNSLSYLFILRLVPLFPFWLVNLAASAFRVPLKNYVIATFFGIMPGTFVYSSVGAGFSSITESADVGFDTLGRAEILLPIAGLVALSLLPVFIKKFTNVSQGDES
jgi:uncharacterized membrane protein YdjX (TVP38/TMEM64 family)